MSKQRVSFLVSIKVIVFLSVLGTTLPAYSGPTEKSGLPQGPPAKGVSDQECNDSVVGKGDSKCLPKEAGNPKKKVVKKAGTAAALGVAGKKVSSDIKDKVSED